jgi:hypothetical protein
MLLATLLMPVLPPDVRAQENAEERASGADWIYLGALLKRAHFLSRLGDRGTFRFTWPDQRVIEPPGERSSGN